MAVSWTVLGSGSKGNCTVLTTSSTQILIDAGFSCRETCRRMSEAGLDPMKTTAILVSHEHSDHVGGVPVLARRLDVPVYMTGATHAAWQRAATNRSNGNGANHRYATAGGPAVGSEEGDGAVDKLELFEAGRRLRVGDIELMPFTIPHDAADPVGFTFLAEGIKLGLATDLGYLSANVVEHVRGCELLMIESNHDLEMLRTGPYPWSVKQRVLSRVGHLSNDDLADFFCNDYDGRAAHLILAHLSEANNHPELARRAAERALGERLEFACLGRRSNGAGGKPRPSRLLLATQNEPLQSIRM
jgi:phosphoribosyl 1,2-cyclic phosphodiesterase